MAFYILLNLASALSFALHADRFHSQESIHSSTFRLFLCLYGQNIYVPLWSGLFLDIVSKG